MVGQVVGLRAIAMTRTEESGRACHTCACTMCTLFSVHAPRRYFCVRNSMVHPRFKSLPPFHTFVFLGEDPKGNNERDPLAGNLDEELGWVGSCFVGEGGGPRIPVGARCEQGCVGEHLLRVGHWALRLLLGASRAVWAGLWDVWGTPRSVWCLIRTWLCGRALLVWWTACCGRATSHSAPAARVLDKH